MRYSSLMRTLYHQWLCPFSRKVRIALNEKRLEFQLRAEDVNRRREEFLALNPAAEVPVLVDEDGTVVADSTVICEYLDERYDDPALLGAPDDSNAVAFRAEARRLSQWFDLKFRAEVTANLVDEKINKRVLGLGQPNSAAIRAGFANLNNHLAYVAYLVERRNWLAGDGFSIADLAAAAHLSCVDYLGDVQWEDYPSVKEWYARVKSRPSFRPLLADHIPGTPPPRHYADLDF